MRGKGRYRNLSRAARRALFVSALLGFGAPWVWAQEIQIRVVNGRNGKPITNECVNISLGPWHGADIVAPTDKSGVVVLHIAQNDVTADTACKGWFKQARRAEGVDTISVMGDYYVACQEYGKLAPGEHPRPGTESETAKELVPTYSIKEILRSGIASANTCGKFRAKPKPGELIFFVRPRSFWERLKQ
jgi:hypothetical protein